MWMIEVIGVNVIGVIGVDRCRCYRGGRRRRCAFYRRALLFGSQKSREK